MKAKIKPIPLVLAIAGLVIGYLSVLALREATLSTHESVPRDSEIEVIVKGHMRGAERGQVMAEMVEAQLLTCRLEVKSDLVGGIAAQGDDVFRAVFRPSMDTTDRRQFRGCVEDWLIDHVRFDVLSLEPLPTP